MNRKKHFFNMIILCAVIVLFIPSQVIGFGTHDGTTSLEWLHNTVGYLVTNSPPVNDPDVAKLRTHAWITWQAIKLFENTYPNLVIESTDKINLIFGSIEEDVDAVSSSPVPIYSDCTWNEDINWTEHHRPINHFYAGTGNDDAAHEYGRLTDSIPDLPYPFDVPRYSAKRWAIGAPENNYNSSNFHTDKSLEIKFLTLGHILHLIEDMGSPAHVRNDVHLLGDHYEQILGEIPFYSHVDFDNEIPAIPLNDLMPIKLTNFSEYFDEIADLTQGNFYSDDTVDKDEHEGMVLQNPNVTYTAITGENGTWIYIVNNQNFQGAKLATARLTDLYAAQQSGAVTIGDVIAYLSHTAGGDHGVIDRECVKDFWQSVAPELIAYSAGAIELFYKNIDSDLDGILDDGDRSGIVGDDTCKGGETEYCDDNCPDVYNPLQEDLDGDGIGDICEPSPQVIAFNVQPQNITDGDSITASYTVTDNQGLFQVELWRAPDESGTPGAWQQLTTEPVSGTTASGDLTDTPSAGTYWYGIHVVDTDNNCTTEENKDCTTGISNGGPDLGLSVPITVNPIITCVDSDGDTYDSCEPGEPGDDGKPQDCNDEDETINPDASEICDNKNNDCDETTADGSEEAWFGDLCDGPDSDQCMEGEFVCSSGGKVCNDNTGDNIELCDGQDNDCDGQVDEGCGPDLPSPPTGLNANYDSLNDWNWITWNAVAEATEYHVYWGTDPGVTKSSNMLTPTSSTEYSHTGVVGGYTYYYRVAAANSAGESDLTEEVSAYVPSEDFPVNFTDSNLEAAIREAISKPTGQIMYSDLQGLTLLLAGSREIIELEGLQYCSNLSNLYLNDNQISDISVLAALTKLGMIRLYGNQINDISPLAGLVNLGYLRLDGNQISDISPLAGLTNLGYLYLNRNQISNISPLAGLTKLSWIYLTDNQITDISPLADLTNLNLLLLDNNQISDISHLAGLVNLGHLRLNDNQISDISALAGLVNLSRLDLPSNQISDISVLAGLTNLQNLSLNDNQISDISVLAGLTNLSQLYLESNQISDISPLAGLTNLGYLYLNRNQISNISPLAGLTNLSRLYLTDNQITDISPLASLTNLPTLGLGNNQISDISVLASMTNLQNLSLHGNQISDISVLAALVNLSGLGLLDNQISDISSLAGLTNLQSLGLGINQISDISPLVSNSGIGSGDWVDVRWNLLDTASCMEHIPELISRGANVWHDCPQIDPQVSSTSGYRSVPDTLYQRGWGFWPGGTAELHFRRPDGSLSPTTTEIVGSDGRYLHVWTITSDAQIGTYQYWAVDLSTGMISPEVDYEIWP